MFSGTGKNKKFRTLTSLITTEIPRLLTETKTAKKGAEQTETITKKI